MGGKAIVETIRKLAITKQLNFLIDLGASLPAISLMSDYSVENRNDALLEKVKEKSNTINSIFKLNNLSLQFIDDLIVQNYSNNIFRIAPDLRINEERI
ncbi:hypothetical protein [uncultured Granulicatella sp.]|uniref:hypothetical protein n=1 Tax=uncultured Granulicatella sp. TaxID=316089 RepID=UPI0028D8616D|nr:hypothetical protein [uncultured Granulicatella sp.]